MNAWNNGFTANINITNAGTSPVNGWTLVFALPSGQGEHLRLERHLLGPRSASASRPPTPATPPSRARSPSTAWPAP
uniref:cellulose binding domain-containing protein n=1 Tax=Herbidospora sakaeratensis TaxID=564415 RepID=UPI001C3F4172|nr:cellulose binding domain-containing protein [Herbidospora sakaeratensis]